MQRQFLQAPLRFARISSRYSAARHHPILRITRPHQGIDYAAPSGTPVWAVADGRVIYRGYAGGFGNLVKIRHSKGYVSYYGHLSRFGSGLKVGQRVRQKQVIGYVGSTGLSTGPHVCFRIAQDGRYFNPAKLHTPAGDAVSAQRRPDFLASRDSAARATRHRHAFRRRRGALSAFRGRCASMGGHAAPPPDSRARPSSRPGSKSWAAASASARSPTRLV